MKTTYPSRPGVRGAVLAAVLCSLILVCSPALEAANPASAPSVVKVEPPTWWIPFTPDLMLLLTGENLDHASVSTRHHGVRVVQTQPGASNHHLFVWLRLTPNAVPGTVPLQVSTPSGTTTVPLLLERRDSRRAHSPGGFSPDDVIYLIMPDRFADGDSSNDRPPHSTGTYDRSQPKAYHGGDLQGIRQHLAYLHDLGVTTLWLTPVWKNTNSDYHGYHVADFYALDDHMGSLQDYQQLVADAHKLGMKVLIDYVVNHTGPMHPWATDPPLASWLHGTPAKHLAPSYDFNGLVDPHAPPSLYRKVLEGWFVDVLPDLNPDDPLLAQYLTENALWWTEIAGLDGFRLDTFPYSTRSFWSGWHRSMRQVYPSLDSIGEVADSHPAITSFFAGGRPQFDGVDSGVTTVFDFPLYDALRDVLLRGAPTARVISVLREDALYPHPEQLVTFIGNHDKPRFMGEAGATKEKLEAAFTLLFTLRGIPGMYSGDEIGLPGGDDPDNRRDFPGGFPGDARNAFSAAGRTPDEQEIFAHVHSLLALRAAHTALRTGHQWHIGWDDSYYAFLRETAEEKILVIFNNASSQRDLTIPLQDTPLESAQETQTLLGTGQGRIDGKALRIKLPPTAVTVLAVK